MKSKNLATLAAVILMAGTASTIAQEGPNGKDHKMPTFSEFDLNGDGVIVAKEFYQARSQRMAERAAAGGKMKHAADAPSFEDIDTNDDGDVSPEEFSAHQALHMKQRRGAR